ncbi:hypothetical protein [Cellulomonas sp. KRMCY2]|nr:hypothetical protein [Cellulomonas sp. KRMCY2]
MARRIVGAGATTWRPQERAGIRRHVTEGESPMTTTSYDVADATGPGS